MVPSMGLEWAMFTGFIIIVAAVVAIIIKIPISSSGSHIYLIVDRREFRGLTILSTWMDYWKFMKELYRMNAKSGIICLGQVFLAAGLQGVPFLPLPKSCAEHKALQRGLMQVPVQSLLFAWHSSFLKIALPENVSLLTWIHNKTLVLPSSFYIHLLHFGSDRMQIFNEYLKTATIQHVSSQNKGQETKMQ